MPTRHHEQNIYASAITLRALIGALAVRLAQIADAVLLQQVADVLALQVQLRAREPAARVSRRRA